LNELGAGSSLNREFWQQIMSVRSAVSKELEKSRAKSDIGSSLNAEIELYCNGEYVELLNKLENELHFIFITSNASVIADQYSPDDAIQTEIEGIKLKVIVSANPKCVRCWHQRFDVSEHAEHPELCGRCIENIDGEGERRRFA
jgi:isoleucyl-tRNA synthetase